MVYGLWFMVQGVGLTVKERAVAEGSHEAFAWGESSTLVWVFGFWVKDLGFGSRGRGLGFTA